MGKDPRREAWIVSIPPVITMAPLWLKFLSLSGIRTGGREREDKWGKRQGAEWGGGRDGEVVGCCGSPPQRATPSPRPVRVSEAELGARGYQML